VCVSRHDAAAFSLPVPKSCTAVELDVFYRLIFETCVKRNNFILLIPCHSARPQSVTQLRSVGPTWRSSPRTTLCLFTTVSRLITFPPTSWLLLPWQASPPGKVRGDAANPMISRPGSLSTSEILSQVTYRGQGDTGHNQRQVTKVRTRTSEKDEIDIQRALKSRQ